MRNRVGIALTTITLTLAASAAPVVGLTDSAAAKTVGHHVAAHRHGSHSTCKHSRRNRHHHGRCTRHALSAHVASVPSKRPTKTRKHPTKTTTTTTPPPAATTSSAPSTGTPPNHVATWAYDDGCNGGTGASAALVQQWVTYAESNCGPAATKASTDCHAAGAAPCTAVAYVDANKIYPDSVPIAQDSQESWWLHQPGFSDKAHRLSTPDFGGGQLLNQTSPGVRSWYQHFVSTSFNSYDGLMMDDTNAGLGAELWGSGATKSQEIGTDAALQAAHTQTSQSMTHADGTPFLQIDNGINVNPYLPTPFKMLNDSSAVHGLIAEGVPENNGTLVSFYSTMLDDMAYVNQTSHDFMVLLSYDPAGSLQSRRVQAASVLLGYSQGHTVGWSDLEQNSSNLAVWPEAGIVPTDAVQSMGTPGGTGCLAGNGDVCSTGGHNDVQVATGVYRREFKTCYQNGTVFGACAAIVNTTGSAVTIQKSWLTQTYSHRVTMNGGDVQSGGTVSLAGADFTPGSTTIAAKDAALLS
jgi:hypothetical protein